MDDATLLVLIFSILTHGLCFARKPVCYTDLGCFDPHNPLQIGIYVPDTPAKVNTQFLLFTRNTPEDNPTILNYLDNSTLQGFDVTKKTIFFVHGMTDKSTNYPAVILRQTLLKKFDVNVILVDWRNGAKYVLNYLRSAVNTLLVGRQMARLLQLLSVLSKLNIKDVHLIGMSLGAHASGFAGKRFKEIANNTIGRITGLDTAGVWFQLQNSTYRLDKTDADFVDAIHTSAINALKIGGIGILPPVGHVDFYPNGGRFQPQCPKSLAQLFHLSCSHNASWSYFVESIDPKCFFQSNPCPNISSRKSTEAYWNAQCNKPCEVNCGLMGYYSNTAPGRGEQYLSTKDNSISCKG